MSEERPAPSFDEILRPWLERDLTADAAAGKLSPAFCVERPLDQIDTALASGLSPVLSGPPGVGKTAIWHEVARRLAAGGGPPRLRGKRIVQLSIRLRAAGLTKPEEIKPEMHSLVEALVEQGGAVVPYFRDIDLAYRFDLEPNLEALSLRLDAPVLGEGADSTVRRLFEDTAQLAEEYLPVHVGEPDIERTRAILEAVSEEREAAGLGPFEADAIETAIALSHRFLARGCFPRKALTLAEQAAAASGPDKPVRMDDVIGQFVSGHRVPRFLIDPRIPLDLRETRRTFTDRLLGQVDAVDAVVNMVGLIKAGLSDLRRPFGVFLFVGPTGVGKTHLAQLLAEYLFGDRDRLVRLNMADYQTPKDAATLFGDPDGYNPSSRRGVLTRRLLGHPFAVVLFDEFEKAHGTVHDRFLQLMDEGAFINGAGETVSCRSNILIATSNAGAEVYRGKYLGFASPPDPVEVRKAVDRALGGHFRVEFLNRLDRVAHFRPLRREEIRAIALRELAQLQQRPGLRRRGIRLEIDEAVLDWLTAHGYDPNHGARFLRRVIERQITGPVARVLVTGELEPGDAVELLVRRGRVVAEPARKGPPPRQKVALPEGPGETTRSLDREGLLAEARGQLDAAQPLLDALAAAERERVEQLARMNAPGFWDSDDARDVVERYRALDVAVEVQTRFASPLRRLRDVLEETDVPVERLARRIEAAARGLQHWLERQARDSAEDVWLLLSTAGTGESQDLLAELVEVEVAWCERLGLDAEIVAWQERDGVLRRVAVAVHGQAAEHLLAMEVGQHRRARREGADARVRVRLVVRGTGAGRPGRVESARRRTGPLGVECRVRGRLSVAERGLTMSLLGPDEATMRELLTDLASALQGPATTAEVARQYGVDGLGARDPRTGATVVKGKDVTRGRLDPLLEAWRRRDG